VTLAPGAIDPRAAIVELVFEQSGESGSETLTFVSVTFPVLVTVIEKLALDRLGIVWLFGFFMIEIDGLCGVGGVCVDGGVCGDAGGELTTRCSLVQALAADALFGSPL
jgi:hypothetical protein